MPISLEQVKTKKQEIFDETVRQMDQCVVEQLVKVWDGVLAYVIVPFKVNGEIIDIINTILQSQLIKGFLPFRDNYFLDFNI